MIHGENSPPLKYELSLKGKFEIWDEGESGSLERRKKKMSVTNPEFADLFYNNPEKENWNASLCSGFPGSSGGKGSACSAGDPGSIPGSGKSPGEGVGYPRQYS